MTEEAAWQAYLDQHPEDHGARCIYADWLEERDPLDPRAAGMRLLGEIQIRPTRIVMVVSGDIEWVLGWSKVRSIGVHNDEWERQYGSSLLETAWFSAILEGDKYGNSSSWRFFDSRAAAEDAAALAWTRLTPEQQAEILETAGVTT